MAAGWEEDVVGTTVKAEWGVCGWLVTVGLAVADELCFCFLLMSALLESVGSRRFCARRLNSLSVGSGSGPGKAGMEDGRVAERGD